MSLLSAYLLAAILPLSFHTIHAENITCEEGPLAVFYALEFDEITTETYETSEGTVTHEIGWKKTMFCFNGHNQYASDLQYPTNSSSYMETIAQFAIAVKLVPRNVIGAEFDSKAVFTKVCMNPVIALNNLLELSYTIDVDNLTLSGPQNANDWYGTPEALSKLESDPTHCDAHLSPITLDLFHTCANHGLHIETNDDNNQKPVCEWDRKEKTGADDYIDIYFGFDVNKEDVCDGRGNGGLQSVLDLGLRSRRRRRRRTRRRRRRRRLQSREYYDLDTGELHSTPCLTLRISLETENLVPTNNDPDPVSNINLVGAALSLETTGGTMQMPDITDPELDENPIETADNTWSIPEECLDPNEVNDWFFPKGDPEHDSLLANVAEGVGGFSLNMFITTPESVIYSYDLDTLFLTISHVCDKAILLSGKIVLNDVVIRETETISLPSTTTGFATQQSLPFKSIEIGPNDTVVITDLRRVRLAANTTYNVIFEGLYDVTDTLCTIDLLLFSDSTRRRIPTAEGDLTVDDFTTDPNPNSCGLLARINKDRSSLIRSDMMANAVTSMCSSSASTAVIAGQFRLPNGWNAIGDFLVRSGSIRVFNMATMTEVYTDTSFPKTVSGLAIKKPCVTVDPSTRRIFSIGGYEKTSGAVVDTITTYVLNETMNGGGVVSDIEGWRLDQPRYGAMCLYWRQDASSEYLVVISGMSNKDYEFTDKSMFLDDILLFPIPANGDTVALWGGTKHIGGISISKTGLIGSRPFLYDNHLLYLWGGKTDFASKKFTQLFDLNNVVLGTAIPSVEAMKLQKSKALPLIQQCNLDVGTEIKSCYCVFLGQSYAAGAIADTVGTEGEPGLNIEHMEVFCNNNIDPEVSIRRRLNDEYTFLLTEYDLKMMEKGKRRRRLQEETEETEISITDYNYALDGIWYDLSVDAEVCFDNNTGLDTALAFYNDVIASKPNGALWLDYADETADAILNESQKAYSTWSNGFGAVNVLDLEIIRINDFRCRPIVQIWVNDGCTKDNIQLWDTNVKWKEEVNEYGNIFDVADGDPTLFTDDPIDILSQKVLNDACDEDNTLSAANYYKGVNIVDVFNNNKSYYPWYYYVIAVIAVYNVIISLCLINNNNNDIYNEQIYDCHDDVKIMV